MFRWIRNRFRKKEKSRMLKLHPPSIIKTDELSSNFRLNRDSANPRDSPLNHIYEEIEEPSSSHVKGQKHKKRGKKVHFLESKCHSVSDISQVPVENPMPETHRRSSSLVSIDDLSSCDRPLPSFTSGSPRPHPVKPPRKNRPTTRRWHTMLEKPDKKPIVVTRHRNSYERNKPNRSRFGFSRQGDYCLETADSDSGYENSNCSSTGSDVVDLSPVTGYEYYLSKIEQLRILEEEVDDLMNDLDMSDISEAHKLINSRVNSPRMGRRCFRSQDIDRHLFEGRHQKFSRLPDPSDYPVCHPRGTAYSRSCESLCRSWASYENVGDDFHSYCDDMIDRKLLAALKARCVISEHLRSSVTDRCGHFFPKGAPEMSSQRNAGYRKPISGASVSRHHTVGAVDVNRAALPNKTLRDLIRDNHHKQYIAAKM